MKIHYQQDDGASVVVNEKHHVHIAYTEGGLDSGDGHKWHADIMYAGARLKDGRRVEFFLNRETNLIVVDVIAKNEKGGREVLRLIA